MHNLNLRKAQPKKAEPKRYSLRPFPTRHGYHILSYLAASRDGTKKPPVSGFPERPPLAMELALNVLGRTASYGMRVKAGGFFALDPSIDMLDRAYFPIL
jgi:hypothetical protein